MRKLTLVLAAIMAVLPVLAVPASAAPAARPVFWTRAPSADGGVTPFPRPDAFCAARVERFPERIPGNVKADHTPGPRNRAVLPWGPWAHQTDVLWSRYLSKVDGHFTGTTDEILEWAACKWGLAQRWVKAQAVNETSWRQFFIGDGGQSIGILQVKDSQQVPLDNNAWGGFPWTRRSTAVDADFQAAVIRATFDGIRGSNFYGGQSVGQIAAAHGGGSRGWDWVMENAVGSWFSGDWPRSEAAQYISDFLANLRASVWLSY